MTSQGSTTSRSSPFSWFWSERIDGNLSIPLQRSHFRNETLVDRRVPKSLLIENGAPTAADRRRIREGIEELRWVASLKPTTIGVAEYRDETREYLEISVLKLDPPVQGGCQPDLPNWSIEPYLIPYSSSLQMATLPKSHWHTSDGLKPNLAER